MVLYGWWYLIGVAFIVLFWALFVAPAERRHWKRRLDFMQERIRRHEEKLEAKRLAEEQLEKQRKERSALRRYRPRSRRHK